MSNQNPDRFPDVPAITHAARNASVAQVNDAMVVKKSASISARMGQCMRGLAVAALACASLSGCASSGDVVASHKPGSYTVAASATGGRMAWARAHQLAMNEARDYCERRGMQSSVTTETVSGVRVMTEHESSVNFECHPKF